MKGEILLNVLEAIEKTVYSIGDFIEDFAASSKSDYRRLRNYQPRYHKTLAESIREDMERKEEEKKINEQRLQEKQRLYEMIYRLQKQGLIQKEEISSQTIIKITKKGKNKRLQLERAMARRIPRYNYPSEKTNELIIVSFDIPETQRIQRDWLRSVLGNLGLRMLQKSVWIGKVKIPKELVDDLTRHNLLNFLEIFSVGKTGTIRHVV